MAFNIFFWVESLNALDLNEMAYGLVKSNNNKKPLQNHPEV